MVYRVYYAKPEINPKTYNREAADNFFSILKQLRPKCLFIYRIYIILFMNLKAFAQIPNSLELVAPMSSRC